MGVLDNLFKGNMNNSNEVLVDMSTYDTSSSTVNSESITQNVDEDTAMGIASLYQGITIISDTIASMPIYLYRNNEGFQEMLVDDPRNNIMSGMANEVLTSYNLKKVMVKDLILYGNSYVKIVRGKGDAVESLYYLPNDVVTPKSDSNGYYFEIKGFDTDVDGEKVDSEVVDFYDMLLLIRNNKYNSVKGTGLLDIAKDTLSLAVEENTYLNNLFRNGLSARAILSSKTPLKREIKQKLKQDLKSFYSGAKNAGTIMVLEGDMNLVPLTLSPQDIKLIEQKTFTISEVARYLNIPKHMLNLDRGQGLYSNITQERLSLMFNTLTPYTVAIEESLNQKLLTEDERLQGLFFKFDTSELLRLTPQDQAQYMLQLYSTGVVTVEEVRKALSLGSDEDTINQLKDIQELKDKIISGETTIDNKSDNTNEDTVNKESSNNNKVEKKVIKEEKEKEKIKNKQ